MDKSVRGNKHNTADTEEMFVTMCALKIFNDGIWPI